jgi:hypothetical protein
MKTVTTVGFRRVQKHEPSIKVKPSAAALRRAARSGALQSFGSSGAGRRGHRTPFEARSRGRDRRDSVASEAAKRRMGSPTRSSGVRSAFLLDRQWRMPSTAWERAKAARGIRATFHEPDAAAYLNLACEKALFGWPCDAEMEKLRDQFARETDPAKQKAIAEAVHVRATQWTPHIHLGQWYQPIAARNHLAGILTAPVPVFWNIDVK